MQFSPLKISDKRIVDAYLKKWGGFGTDYAFASWFSWYDFSKMSYTEADDVLYIRGEIRGEKVFLSPLCSDEKYPFAVSVLRGVAKEENLPLKIVFATENQIKTLDGAVKVPNGAVTLEGEQIIAEKNDLLVSSNRDNSEYVYLAENLINLSGKHYHSKRNFVTRFKKQYAYSFETYTDEMFDDAVRLINTWAAEKSIDDEEEIGAFTMMLKHLSELSGFADELEKADDFKAALNALIKRVISEHKRIVFNGNNYSEEWLQEAAARGLLNLKTTPDALALLSSDKNVALFEKHGVFTKEEVESRQEILFESYTKTLSIEALTMLDMVRKVITPAVIGYVKELSETALAIKSAGIDADISTETELVKKLSALLSAAGRHSENLTAALLKARSLGEGEIAANCYRDDVIPAMQLLRSDADLMEELTAKKHWPLPTYTDLLYSVN